MSNDRCLKAKILNSASWTRLCQCSQRKESKIQVHGKDKGNGK